MAEQADSTYLSTDVRQLRHDIEVLYHHVREIIDTMGTSCSIEEISRLKQTMSKLADGPGQTNYRVIQPDTRLMQSNRERSLVYTQWITIWTEISVAWLKVLSTTLCLGYCIDNATG